LILSASVLARSAAIEISLSPNQLFNALFDVNYLANEEQKRAEFVRSRIKDNLAK
jgi:hypothetical protein